MAERCAAESAATIGIVGMTQRSDNTVSIPSPAAINIISPAETHGVARRPPIARLGLFDRRLVFARGIEPGSMRPVDVASRSVTAAIIAPAISSVGASSPGR